MRWPLLASLAAQIPFSPPQAMQQPEMAPRNFSFLEGPDRFTPKDLIELARPGTGVANELGTLVFVPVSKYSFADKKCAHTSSCTRSER
jgi:hypothetical protein